MLTYKNPKARPCEVCQNLFVPDRMGQLVCRPACAMRKVRQEKVAERAKVRTRKEAIKTIPELVKEAQREFNAYIRQRDARRPCISCGLPLDNGDVGGGFDCGHYRSIGSAGHLRFNPDNAHGQCKRCNRWLHGRVSDYRIGLLERVGAERLAAIEGDSAVHKWTREELIAIRDTYRAKLKEMKK